MKQAVGAFTYWAGRTEAHGGLAAPTPGHYLRTGSQLFRIHLVITALGVGHTGDPHILRFGLLLCSELSQVSLNLTRKSVMSHM